MSETTPKTVLVTGANGYIGNAVARAFVRAGWTTYGLVRSSSLLDSLAADEIIPLLGSPADHSFLSTLSPNLRFDVIVSTTEQIMNYIPHYNDIVSLLTVLAKKSIDKGKGKPLVLFTSGCKDYGMMSETADSPGLKPHTEESPIQPPPFAVGRATYAVKIFDHAELFDAVVLRPTNVYGLSSSFYGYFFRLAKEGKEKGFLELNEHPKTILHALHVDDCGNAYVALAEHSKREDLGGECFNISSWRFETLEEIAGKLVEEYGIEQGVKWGPIPEGKADVVFERGLFVSFLSTGRKRQVLQIDVWPDDSYADVCVAALIGFSQWTGSDKLRKLTGWKDQRPLFTQGLKQYRLAYEAAIAKGYQNRIQKMMAEMKKGGV
jgi:nucleoside-diphosphate-sugar epimerase